jgi:alcohol dehydrogenase
MDFNMYVPTKILFGSGTLNELDKQQLPGKKAVIIISNGYLSRTEEQLAQAGVTTSVFDKIQPNPLKETVMEGAAFVKAQGADFIVALGGGSVIDSAKAIAVMAANPGDLWDYIASGTGKGQPIKNKPHERYVRHHRH